MYKCTWRKLINGSSTHIASHMELLLIRSHEKLYGHSKFSHTLVKSMSSRSFGKLIFSSLLSKTCYSSGYKKPPSLARMIMSSAKERLATLYWSSFVIASLIYWWKTRTESRDDNGKIFSQKRLFHCKNYTDCFPLCNSLICTHYSGC